MEEFDHPLFKRLAHNDTGKAAGHQAGILIPKAIERYFPLLEGAVSVATPTVDVRVKAALFVGSISVGLADARYQYQTWGGTRPPERRITGELGPLRNAADAGDILLIERGIFNPNHYRLTLHKTGTAAFASLNARTGTRQWGAVDPSDPPVAETDILALEGSQAEAEGNPLALFDNAAALQETVTRRIARSRAFKKRLLPLYDFRCAVCGHAHETPEGLSETEAAHIVPRSLKGADDSRNGLALCRSHHWAFDAGLFGILPTRHILIAPRAAALPANAHLLPFDGLPVRAPITAALLPDLNALAWHLTNVVIP